VISLKSTNSKATVVTAPAACIPQLLSKASRDPKPYRFNVSPSISDKLSFADLQKHN